MRPPIFARPFRKEDAQQFSEWAIGNAANSGLDAGVLGYPSTEIICAERGGNPVLYVPIQRCLVMESMAPNPQASDVELALALDRIVSTVVWKSRQEGNGEILFSPSEPRIRALALANGFKDYPMMRIRV